MSAVPAQYSPWVTAAENTIPRKKGVSYEQFVHQHLKPAKPVVLIDGAAHWPAVKRWNPELFRAELGDRLVPIGDQYMRVADFIDGVVNATQDRPAPYLQGTGEGRYLADLFPELVGDIDPEPIYAEPNWLTARFFPGSLRHQLNRGPRAEIFFGGLGAGFSRLHWDMLHVHVFAAQVFGTKSWLLFSPDDSPNLYPHPKYSNVSEVSDLFAADVEKFPLLRKAQGHRVLLEPGEMLFVPAGWWHTTTLSEPSISISINSANASNWRSLVRDIWQQKRFRRAVVHCTSLLAFGAMKAARRQN